MMDGRKALRASDPDKIKNGKTVVAFLSADQYQQAFNLALHHKTSLAEAIRIAISGQCERDGIDQ